MAESYSTSLKLTIIGAGDLAGTWGNVTNANLGTLLEQAITGVQAINISGLTTYTLTNINGALDDARNAVLVFQGGTSACTITCPGGSANKVYAIVNQGSYPITMSASGGSATLVIPGGMTAQVYLDGTNQSGSGVGVYSLLNGVPGDFKVVGTLTAAGETDTGNMSVGGTLSVTGTTTLNGTSTAPTPSPGDNSTKIATTAFVNNITGSLGTMSQQNANSVAITGGNIDGTIIGNSTAAAGTFTTLGGTTITASSQFSGPGTGLTGTAASLSIGGNAATATSATSATTATNATNATNVVSGGTIASNVTATTQSSTDNSTKIATTAFVQAAMQILYPVGSIYTSTVSTNPNTLFGFGTWVAFGAGRVMIGQDGSSFIAGATGGSADAIIVSHTHTFSGTTNTGNANISQNAGVYGNNGTVSGPFSSYAGYGSIAPAQATISDSGHTHTFSGTTASQGSSGTNANLQPYIVVYMWNRTA